LFSLKVGCGHFLDTERKVSFTFKESAIGRTTDTARVFGRLSRACVCVCVRVCACCFLCFRRRRRKRRESGVM